MFSIASMLEQLKTAQRINLDEKNLDADQIQEVVAELSKNSALQELRLAHNHFGAEGVRALTTLVKSNTLTHLWLDNNALGDEGARAIAELLAVGCLDFLSLSDIGITHLGARALAAGLKERRRPIILVLNQNPIGDRGARHFAWLLTENNHALADLYLERTQITDEGATALCEAFEVNDVLIRLSLMDNPIQNQNLLRRIERLTERNLAFRPEAEWTGNGYLPTVVQYGQQLQATAHRPATTLITDIPGGARAYRQLQEGDMEGCLQLYRSLVQEQPPEVLSLALAERLVAENFSDESEFSLQEKWTLILAVLRGLQSEAAISLQSQARHFLRTGRAGLANAETSEEVDLQLPPLLPLIDKLIVAFSQENQTKRMVRNLAFPMMEFPEAAELSVPLLSLKTALLDAISRGELEITLSPDEWSGLPALEDCDEAGDALPALEDCNPVDEALAARGSFEKFNQLVAASQRVIHAISRACDQETPDYDKIEEALAEYQQWETQTGAEKTFVAEVETWVHNNKSPAFRP